MWSCILTYFGYAQNSIEGRILDSNGEFISGAHIQLLNSAEATASREDGSFEIQTSTSSGTLQVSALGYATRAVHFVEGGVLNIVLREAIFQLDDVVVSALKREQELTKIPLAVTSLNAKKIEDTRTWGLSGLSALVPNYLYQESGVPFQALQSIRGIQVFSENPAIATYVDDVNSLDILALGFQFTDIERIEVLRGPQGTLFGRNAMGGVVNIVTKQPTDKTEGFWEAGFGNLELQRHRIGLKTPIVRDKLFFGFNGLFQNRGGFYENDDSLALAPNPDLNGEKVGESRNVYGSLFLKWLPTNSLQTIFNVKAQKDWSRATGFFVSQPNEEVAFENPDKIYLSRLGRHDRDIWNVALTLRYGTENVRYTSIATYQRIGLAFQDVDSPGIYHSFFSEEIGEKLPPQEVWTQEFRIQSANPSKPLQYTTGVFGFTQDAFEPTTNLAFEVDLDNFIIFRNSGRNSGAALFGELTYNITDKISATGGLRYDYESREATFNGFGNLLLSNGTLMEVIPDISEKGTYSALSPKVALRYSPNATSTAYLSYTRGFRAGGINAQRLPDGIAQTFDEEYSDNFELGYKLNAYENKLTLSAAAFYIKWTNLQFFNLVALGTFARENVGDANSIGFEIETSIIPLRGFQIDASFGYTDTEYLDFTLRRSDFVTGEEIRTEISGNSLSNAPSHTLFLSPQYTTSLSKKASLVVRGEIRNVGRYFTDIQNTLEQPNYTLVNGRVAYTQDRYTLALWGQNLTDTTYLAFGTPDTSFGSRSVRTALPRTFGGTLTYRF